jgi:hypothetical protein
MNILHLNLFEEINFVDYCVTKVSHSVRMISFLKSVF